jgi:O-glycosyl hydrolase
MTNGLCEILWIKGLLKELGYPMEIEIKMYCDNKVAIVITNNLVQHDRTKHVKVDRHFIKQKLDEKTVIFSFVKSEDQLVDILTKTVSSKVFHCFL